MDIMSVFAHPSWRLILEIVNQKTQRCLGAF